MGLFDRVLRTGEGKKLKAVQALLPDIGALEPEMERLSDDELRAKTGEFRSRLDRGATLDDLLIESFAVVREAARRTIGQRHYDVQLMGGAALHFGWVAEMKTGEGKTLVSTLPVYLNGLSGEGVHVITVNDYLARRDAEWMGQIHGWMGLSIGLVVNGESDPAFKREQYACDITYGTNNEFGFDYLRDNMAMSRERQVQRGHVYAIVDEVDSILIDEARTPLIISGKVADAAALYTKFAAIARQLRREEHYDVDEEKRIVAPTEEGVFAVEQALGVENLYDEVSSNMVHQLQAALKAKELFHRDKDYIIQNGEVNIVDEFTGRVLEGRRWSEGLHQAVEAKEGVKIKEENQTLATITIQNYFRLYDKLAGMTGTAETEAAELAGTYELQVVPVPTNRGIARADQPDLVYKSEDAKFAAVVDDVEARYQTGQPVLCGTASVDHSEKLGRLLEQRGIRHEVLNAKQHAREAEIVTQAGQLGAVTVATNMAGRGVDILLGGNPEGLALKDLRNEGVQAATADEIRRRGLETRRLIERLERREGTEERVAELRERLAEHEANERRLDELVDKYAEQTTSEGENVRQLGGLYVLGTERHESRRIDNQLRGRSGRQGDPGESRFYLSLEDELMRLFATGAMEKVMSAALPDDLPIESKMVTKAVERAQTTVEQRNAEIRKNVLKYDEVMNEQRKVIYERRAQILDDEDLRADAVQAIHDAADGVVATHCVSDYREEWDLDSLLTEVGVFWPTEISIADLSAAKSTEEIRDLVIDEGVELYEQREAELGPETMRDLERKVMIQIMDQKWREHLQEMDYLQAGINLRAMGQKDPLTEWQREGFDMFEVMMTSTAQDFVTYIMHMQVVTETEPDPATEKQAEPAEPPVADVSYSAPDGPVQDIGASTTASGPGQASEPAAPAEQVPVVKSDLDRVGRNDPCPCASGNKFKACYLRPGSGCSMQGPAA